MLRYSCLITGILLTLIIIAGLFSCRLGGFPVAPGKFQVTPEEAKSARQHLSSVASLTRQESSSLPTFVIPSPDRDRGEESKLVEDSSTPSI